VTAVYKPLNIDIMIQARMGSTRLSGKIMLPLGDNTILGTMIDRVKRAGRVRHVIVLTTDLATDDAVVELAESHGVRVFRGSESDLLDRYYRAALYYGTDVIVRLTGDCPFMDPALIDNMVNLFQFNCPRIEFLTNCNKRTFARGLDVEIFSCTVLGKLNAICKSRYYREHVIPYVEEHPEEFAFVEYPNIRDDSAYRLTVDTDEDYKTVTGAYNLLNCDDFTYEELIDALYHNRDVLCNLQVRHKSYKE